jgi:hypothetical protein
MGLGQFQNGQTEEKEKKWSMGSSSKFYLNEINITDF